MSEPDESLVSPNLLDGEGSGPIDLQSDLKEFAFTELIHFSDDDEPTAQEIALPDLTADLNADLSADQGVTDDISENDANICATIESDIDRLIGIETISQEPSSTALPVHVDYQKEQPEDHLLEYVESSCLHVDQKDSTESICNQLLKLPETTFLSNPDGSHEFLADVNSEHQILLLRRIVGEVGLALSKRFDTAAGFILPEVLDEASTSELILELKSLVSQLSKEPSAAPQQVVERSPPESEWVEVNEWQPTPDYGLDSPIITHLLSNWTNDNAKVDFLRSWVRSLYMPSYEAQNYPPGLQITNLTCVLRDGFMVLLIPLIRSLSKPPITVHVKKHSRAPIPVPVPVPHSAAATEATDTFAQDDYLYDIRVKRLDVTLSTESVPHSETAGASSGASAGASVYAQGANAEGYVSDQVAAHNYHQQRAGLKHRVDSQSYYSPLAEINSFLPVIEAKTKRSIDVPTSPTSHSRKSFSEEPHVVPSAPPSTVPAQAPAPPAMIPSYTLYAPTSGLDAATAEAAHATAAMPDAAAAPPNKPVPAPAPSILQSIFSWWEPVTAPAASAAPSSLASAGTVEATTPADAPATAQQLDESAVNSESTQTEPGKTITSTTPSSVFAPPSPAEAINLVSGASISAPIPAAAPTVNPVNKIAERLQQMRAQKQQQQLSK